MTLPIGAHVEILANAVHPQLEGRIGVIVSITQHQRCAVSHIRHARGARCGGNYILEVAGMGRFLLRPQDVSACLDEAPGVEKSA